MLIEIFSDSVYDQTPCDPERGIASRRVPKIIVSERGNTRLNDMYIKARDFLTVALDNTYYSIQTGGSYMLEIECVSRDDHNSLTSTTSRQIPEKKFQFKFNSLRDTMDSSKNVTIHGELIIDDHLNVISFSRDRVSEAIVSSNTFPTKLVTDSTSTSGRRIVTDETVVTGGSCRPFDDGCQQEEPSESSEDAGSVTTNEDSGNPVELSKNSFSVRRGIINVSDPEMEIGTIDGSSFAIDTEKQKRQDEFLKNMSRKISKRNRDTRNPK